MIEKVGLVTVGLLTGIVGTVVTAKVITNRRNENSGGSNGKSQPGMETTKNVLDELAGAVSEVADVETW